MRIKESQALVDLQVRNRHLNLASATSVDFFVFLIKPRLCAQFLVPLHLAGGDLMEVVRENAAHHFCMNDDVERVAFAEGENVVFLEESFHTSRMGAELKKVKPSLLDEGDRLFDSEEESADHKARHQKHGAEGETQLEQIGLVGGQFVHTVEQNEETENGPEDEGGDEDGGHCASRVAAFYGKSSHFLRKLRRTRRKSGLAMGP